LPADARTCRVEPLAERAARGRARVDGRDWVEGVAVPRVETEARELGVAHLLAQLARGRAELLALPDGARRRGRARDALRAAHDEGRACAEVHLPRRRVDGLGAALGRDARALLRRLEGVDELVETER